MSSTFVPTPPSPELPPPAPRRPRRGLVVLLALGCAAGGAAGGMALKAAAPAPEVAHAAEDHEPDEPAQKAVPAAEPATPARVDTLLRAGCYADALAAYRALPPGAFADEYRMAYREALCLEGLGKFAEADAAYLQAGKDGSVGGWARALLGRARCALASGAAAEGRALADRVLLRSGHPECRGGRVAEEAAHLRAHAGVLEAGTPAAPDPLDAEARAWPPLRAAPDKYLDWLPADAPAASPDPDSGRDVAELYPRKEAANPDVTLRLAKRPALDVLRALAAAAGLELRAEPAPAARLVEAVGPVEVERLPLDDVLSALCERAGVAWAVRAGALHLSDATAAPPERAARALRTALAADPPHPSAAAMRVTLGNLDAAAGRTRAAALGYKQVLEGPGNGPELASAAYNLGLLELKAGDRNGARARFLEVLDRGPGSRLADVGCGWLGRTYLDGDDPAAARQWFRTAADAKTKEAASAGALGVCLCDLLTGDEDAARRLLADTKFSTREAHAAVADFYTALLRYRAAPTVSRRDLLLGALRGCDDVRRLGPGGAYLAGRVYLELGRGAQMAALYDKEVATARGPLALRMIYDAAERFDRLDSRAEARTRYLSLAAVDPTGLGPVAEVKLAALDVRDGNAADAIRRCRGLLARPGAPRAEALAVMGRGYELQKRFADAAACFAGRLPE